MMKSAPSITRFRTAARRASTPSAWPPINHRCPPVMVRGGPDTSVRGPSISPWSRPSFSEKAVRFQEPQSARVVTPVASASAALRAARSRRMSSESSRSTSSPVRPSPGILVWVWQSNRPGSSVASGNSITSRGASLWALSSSPRRPIQMMPPLTKATAMPSCGVLRTPSMSLPGRITVSGLRESLNLQLLYKGAAGSLL